jgi:prepilin-type N-terminal cleavage/methylation domain-containing protein
MDRIYTGFGRLSCKAEDGFTLLEVLGAIVILGIIVIPLLGLLIDALIVHAQREQQTRSVFLAQLRLEEIKSKIITASDFATADYNKPAGAAGDFPPPDSRFKYTVTHDDHNYPDIKAVTVTVWYDEDGDDTVSAGEQQVKLDTKVTRRR